MYKSRNYTNIQICTVISAFVIIAPAQVFDSFMTFHMPLLGHEQRQNSVCVCVCVCVCTCTHAEG
jgi:hypothetical protein